MKLHGNLNLAETNFQMSKILFSLSDESGALDYANTAVLKSPNTVNKYFFISFYFDKYITNYLNFLIIKIILKLYQIILQP